MNALAELEVVAKLVLLMPSLYSHLASVCGPQRGGQSAAMQAPLGVHALQAPSGVLRYKRCPPSVGVVCDSVVLTGLRTPSPILKLLLIL